jgi:hypothetical protein
MTDAPEMNPDDYDPAMGCFIVTNERYKELFPLPTRADVSRAAVEAAYIAGLDAAIEAVNDTFWNEAVRFTVAERLRALKDPAHVAAAVANIMEKKQCLNSAKSLS